MSEESPDKDTGFIRAFCYCIALGLLVHFGYSLAGSYDLFLHGKITKGTVKSIKKKVDYLAEGSPNVSYDLTMSYDGHDAVIECPMGEDKCKRIEPGSEMDVYYSTNSPANVIFRNPSHPFRSMTDVIMVGSALQFYLVAVAMVIGYGEYRFRRGKATK